VLSPAEIEDRLERVLLTVQKPGRYTGGELNQIVKNWEDVSTRVALVFPDIYDIGVPNLGLAILYDELNQRADVVAERAYCPWTDMESVMRSKGIPLYSLETKHALSAFDIIGFSLPYESLYSNVLNALDLAGIPVFSRDRTENHPLIIAGGHAAFNPEPMADFLDAFIIGEGEEVIHEVVNAYQTWKISGTDRTSLLQRLSQVQGVYVPALYRVEYHPDGTISGFFKNWESAPLPITKRILAQLPPPVTRFLVPNIDVVHNRVAIEIMRGCTRGCRFCQAGMITRPVRERPVDQVVDAIEDALLHTGYEEVGLLSLSSSDYANIVELVQKVSDRFQRKNLKVALPSLRIDSFSVSLMDKLKELRPGGGFTLAPEAATDRMRQIINKYGTTQQLLDTAREIYSHGWTTIKLYFMIGHPLETIEDVQAIIDLCKAVLAEGRKIIGRKAKVNAGVSTFIPKPHTPFQWVSCDSIDHIVQKQDLLKHELRDRDIKLTWTEPETTLLEAWLSRGDRRMSQVIYRAWQLGTQFDAWQESFKIEAWRQAFQEAGLDPDFYSHRERGLDETLPWEHISSGVHSGFLKQDYQWSQEERFRDDCRNQCFACGILPGFSDLRSQIPADAWKCPPSKTTAKRQKQNQPLDPTLPEVSLGTTH
jgi:radical SAM family uncharacterized protein